MSTHITDQTDVSETQEHGEAAHSSPATGALSTVRKAANNGTVLSIVGSGLLALAARNIRRNRLRAVIMAIVGGTLLGVGVQRRRSETDTSSAGDDHASEHAEHESPDVGTADGSAEASAHLEQSRVTHQPETNPRGTADEPDLDPDTEHDEGDVQFTTEQTGEEPEPKPHLDDDAPEDPRTADEDDQEPAEDHVTVDISEAAMADETSEATGPTDEQAYPSSEGTDPEPTSPEAPERQSEGHVANEGTDTGTDGTSDLATDEESPDELDPADADESTDADESADGDEERS